MKLSKSLPRISILLAGCLMVSGLWGMWSSARLAQAEEAQPPIEVQVGIKVEDIVEVNQQRESFTVVGSIRMEWKDPELSYSTEDCQCEIKVYTRDDFGKFLTDSKDRWPDFTFHNQHGDRWVQNRLVVVYPDGSASYYERFTTDFHTNFDFRRFPFDRQQFSIHVDLIYPEEIGFFKELHNYSGISEEYGAEELVLTDFSTQISSIESSSGVSYSRYSIQFEGPRHLEYYIFRIFFPILGILLISWAVFFLKDFQKRIEVALANVVLYITFSFSIADNYPRLGYPTFLDAIMSITLIANILVVLCSVYFKALENKEMHQLAERIDRILIWLYPVSLILGLVVILVLFFR